MQDIELTYEEIQKFVNHLSDKEFTFLIEAIYEKMLDGIEEEKEKPHVKIRLKY